MSIQYIYKVRLKNKNKHPELNKTYKILRLHHKGVSSAEIAEQIGCSKQYVYKVVAEKNKENRIMVLKNVKKNMVACV